MGTGEELLFEEYHGMNATCQLLCWIWTRNSWRSFRVTLWVLLLVGNFSNRVTRMQSIYVLLPASTMLSSFIDCQISWDRPLLGFTSRLTIVGSYFLVVSITVGLEAERSCLSVIVALDLELLRLGSRDVLSRLPRCFGKTELGLFWRWIRVIVGGKWWQV